MSEAKNSDYFGKSPFDDLKNVTNTVMDVIKQGRERKLAIARATFEVSAKQQEDLKNQQSEDSADDMKAEREKKKKNVKENVQLHLDKQMHIEESKRVVENHFIS